MITIVDGVFWPILRTYFTVRGFKISKEYQDFDLCDYIDDCFFLDLGFLCQMFQSKNINNFSLYFAPNSKQLDECCKSDH